MAPRPGTFAATRRKVQVRGQVKIGAKLQILTLLGAAATAVEAADALETLVVAPDSETAREAFASAFWLPLLLTAIMVLHFVSVDTFAVGAARTPYKLMYPFTGEGGDAKKLVPFLRALRAQQNTVEQGWAFMVAMWACAFSCSPTFAGIAGCLWCGGRIGYGYAYRVTSKVSRLLIFTIPCYLGQVLACGGILSSIIPLSPLGARLAAGFICVFFIVYGAGCYRPWYQNFVKAEKDKLDGVEESTETNEGSVE